MRRLVHRHKWSCTCGRACLLLACSLVSMIGQSEAVCRQANGAEQPFCGLPYELSNFQGRHKCNASVVVGRPTNLQELSALVKAYDHVKGSGVGHSWNGLQFCSGTDAHAINIVTTEMEPAAATLQGDPGAAIDINEDDKTVTVAAGVSLRVLLDYLDKHQTAKAPDGWTLPAFPWFIDQTVGGAVATGSHGSSLRFGSMSSQVTQLQLMLANGTLTTITPTNAHLWHAARVSIGRLGIITSLTFRMAQNQPVQRNRQGLVFRELQSQMGSLQADYVAAKAAGGGAELWRVLQPWDETQVFWFLPSRQVWKMTYTHHSNTTEPQPPPTVEALDDSHQEAAQQLPTGAYGQVANPAGAVPGAIGMDSNTFYWNAVFMQALLYNTYGANLSARASYLSQSEIENQLYSSYNAYDQYELAIPLDKVGDCFDALGSATYGAEALWDGFRSPALLRFVAGEAAYLSPTHTEPRLYINVEDHISAAAGKPNKPFQRFVDILRSPVCSGRMHWGKAGWPQHAKCFDGSVEYGDAWCCFGCAVQQLDPGAKFEGTSGVWKWQAAARWQGENGSSIDAGGSSRGTGGIDAAGSSTSGSSGSSSSGSSSSSSSSSSRGPSTMVSMLSGAKQVQFSSCCTPDGFDTTHCVCAPRTDC